MFKVLFFNMTVIFKASICDAADYDHAADLGKGEPVLFFQVYYNCLKKKSKKL